MGRRDSAGGKPLTLEMILDWGQMIEPVKNRHGFRTGKVRVSGFTTEFPEGRACVSAQHRRAYLRKTGRI